jgi:hypothetical protein
MPRDDATPSTLGEILAAAEPKGGPVKQVDHDGCFQACVASLLGLELSEVPNFYRDAGGAAGFTQMPEVYAMIRDWCRPRGLAPLFLPSAFPLEQLLAHMDRLNPGTPFILSGTSSAGTGHAVIACHGRIIHEPTPGYGPDDGGVVAPGPGGEYEVTFFTLAPTWTQAARAQR